MPCSEGFELSVTVIVSGPGISATLVKLTFTTSGDSFHQPPVAASTTTPTSPLASLCCTRTNSKQRNQANRDEDAERNCETLDGCERTIDSEQRHTGPHRPAP